MAEERKNDEAPPGDKSDTSRIDLSEAQTADENREAGEPMSVRQVLGRPAAGEPPDGGEEAKDATAHINLQGDAEPERSAPKSSTSRIDLNEAKPPPDETAAVSKDSTVRVDLTAVMARAGVASPEAKKKDEDDGDAADSGSTARIAVAEAAAAAPPSSTPPRTVRLKRPSDMPKTVSVPRPDAPPKTVMLKKPGAESDGKESTSRIAVPDGAIDSAPPSSRKTIRIKRSSAPSSAKTLTIARPARTAAPTLPGSADETLRELEAEIRDEPGTAFGIVAIAALLVLGVLVYVLAAQTVAPDLPFPGRMM